MCTIIVRHRMDYFCSTIVAVNRDEFYARRATGPQVLCEDPLIVGGRDEDKGGTWFGVTKEGLFMGLTNQRNWGKSDSSLTSRGELVIEALRAGSITGLKDRLGSVSPREYNEFNVIFGDGRELWAGYGRHEAEQVEFERLGTDAYVLCNDRLGSPEFPKAKSVRTRVRRFSRTTWPKLLERFVEVLADHASPLPGEVPEPPEGAMFDHATECQLQAACVHTPVYGTVSSSLVVLKPGKVLEFLATDGPPCENAFQDFKHLLA